MCIHLVSSSGFNDDQISESLGTNCETPNQGRECKTTNAAATASGNVRATINPLPRG
jgi:hypothetical protein